MSWRFASRAARTDITPSGSVQRAGIGFQVSRLPICNWARESEFRLVRTDLSTEPHYFDITEALIGVVLGDAFSNDRVPALLMVLAGFDDLAVLQAW